MFRIFDSDLMIVSVASGKGGTGETSVGVNMALSIQFLNRDVEEPKAHLFLNPKTNHAYPVTISVPFMNQKFCDNCGKCGDFCQCNALFVGSDRVLIFSKSCPSAR
jgi:MinD superfamily P-loop ATPase